MIIGLQKAQAQCNTNISICSQGTAGPYSFWQPGPSVSTCLDFIGPSYAYITLYITQSGPLELLIDGDASNGFLDVAIFDVPQGMDPCVAIQDDNNQIGCNYASYASGCNQFGTYFGCSSSVPSPYVNAGDELMIVVENWSGASSSFTMDLAPAPAAQTGAPDASIAQPGVLFDNSLPQTLGVINGGGTFSASCGDCIDPQTGVFDPSVAGVGTHSICYEIGAAPCNAMDCKSIVVESSLAVEMGDVKTTCENGVVKFEWTTVTETNCDYFIIEKSRSGDDFEQVAIVDGHGTTMTPQNYVVEDIFEDDVKYYSLIEMDYNGEATNYGLFYVDCQKPEMNVYPNPGQGEVTVEFSGFNIGEAQVAIYDNAGKLILEPQMNPGVARFSSNEIAQGMYTIIVRDTYKTEIKRYTNM